MRLSAVVFRVCNGSGFNNFKPVELLPQVGFGEIMDRPSGFTFEGIRLCFRAQSETSTLFQKKQ